MLTYLYIILMFLLLPVRMLFSFVSQFFWFPKFKLNRQLDKFVISDTDYARVIEKAQTNLDDIGDGGDGAKFLSFYHFASRVDPENVPVTDHMYRFYHEDKTFMRKFKLEDNIGYTNFSGDMMAGIVFARTADVLYDIRTRASDYVSIIRNIVFNSEIPFMVPHPHGDHHGRGFIWPIWGDGADVLKCVAMIDSAITVGKQIGMPQYHLMFIKYLILITNFPLYIWSYDSAFVGNAYLTKWFGPHSRFLYITSGYMLTGSWYYKLAMKRLFKKYHKIVPDIAYLYKYVFPEENVDLSYANYLVDDYVKNGKGTQVYNGPKVMCTHVENLLLYPFKKEEYKVERSSMVLEAKYRYETSIWEREPFKFKTGDQNNKRANCLDLILTSTLSRKI